MKCEVVLFLLIFSPLCDRMKCVKAHDKRCELHESKDMTRRCCQLVTIPPGNQLILCELENSEAAYEPCRPGTFQSQSHNSSNPIYCQKHTVCNSPNAITVKNGSDVSDVECECNKADGFYNKYPNEKLFQVYYCEQDYNHFTNYSAVSSVNPIVVNPTETDSVSPNDNKNSNRNIVGPVIGVVGGGIVVVVVVVIFIRKRRHSNSQGDRPVDVTRAQNISSIEVPNQLPNGTTEPTRMTTNSETDVKSVLNGSVQSNGHSIVIRIPRSSSIATSEEEDNSQQNRRLRNGCSLTNTDVEPETQRFIRNEAQSDFRKDYDFDFREDYGDNPSEIAGVHVNLLNKSSSLCFSETEL